MSSSGQNCSQRVKLNRLSVMSRDSHARRDIRLARQASLATTRQLIVESRRCVWPAQEFRASFLQNRP
jgi:hypothetical protein